MHAVVRTVYLVHRHTADVADRIAPIIDAVKAVFPPGSMEFPPKAELHLSLGQWRVEESMLSEAKLRIASVLLATDPIVLTPTMLQHIVVRAPRRKDKVYTQARVMVLYEPAQAFDILRSDLDRQLREVAVPRRKPYVSSQPHNTIGFGLNGHIAAPLLPSLPDAFRSMSVSIAACDLEILVKRGRGSQPLETIHYPFNR